MNYLPAFSAWSFAVAGAVCAAGPVIIHLLNRRRFRIVEWAAMQFLREAMQRSRRIMQIRDLLLLIMRTAAVLFFGLALARPHFASRGEHFDAGQPVHAILLIDNSLSMGHLSLEGSVLDRAKKRAAAYIEKLPLGSRVTVIPLCGAEQGFSREPFDTKPFALDALERIKVVDRSAGIRQAINESRAAAATATNLAKRYLLFSDQQRANWSDAGSLLREPDLPPLQMVHVAHDDFDNTWISGLRVQDGVADGETPAIIHVTVTHRGSEPRGDVRVALHIDGDEVDSRIISLDSADVSREVSFEHTFRDVRPESSRPEYSAVKVSLTPDKLPGDDERFLVVPVVAALPVMFVDQYGEDEENPIAGRFGETRHMRQLLSPAGESEKSQELVQVRHRRIEQLDRDAIADTRLVVVAGVETPVDKVDLLREYVEQGGQLVIAAGAEFDAEAWNGAAWRDGAGILPLPLADEPIGVLPELAGSSLQPFFLSFESLGQSPYFELVGNSEQELRDLYAEPFFFKAVRVQASSEIVTALQQTIAAQLAAEEQPGSARKSPGASLEPLPPRSWLLWSPPEDHPGAPAPTDGSAEPPRGADPSRENELRLIDFSPRILARFTSESGPPFLVDRRIGRGRVLFASSGLLSSWNTLPKTNAIVMFDRILREMIQSTLPRRTYVGVDRIGVPIPDEVRDAPIVLVRPGEVAFEESLEIGFLGKDRMGVTIERPLTRGLYLVRAMGTAQNDVPGERRKPRFQMSIAVNGDADESDLTPLDRATLGQVDGQQSLSWIGGNEEISLAGNSIRGQNLWWWLVLAVLALLIAELATLLFFGRRGAMAAMAR